MPRRSGQDLLGECARTSRQGGRIGCPGLHRLPWRTFNSWPQGSRVPGQRDARFLGHLRALPWRGALGGPLQLAYRCGALLRRQLSRAGNARRLANCRQLRFLPRCSQHLPAQRPALHGECGKPLQNLRAVPLRRGRTLRHRSGACAHRHRRCQPHRKIHPHDLLGVDSCDSGIHGAAQRVGFHFEADSPPLAAERRPSCPHESVPTLGALGFDRQLHHAGDYRICAQVSRRDLGAALAGLGRPFRSPRIVTPRCRYRVGRYHGVPSHLSGGETARACLRKGHAAGD